MKLLFFALSLLLAGPRRHVHGPAVAVEAGCLHDDYCGHSYYRGSWHHAHSHRHFHGRGHRYRSGLWIRLD